MWIATNTCTGRSLKFLFLEIESMALIAQWCIFFSFFFSLLELKNNRAIFQVKVYKCNWKKKDMINLLIWIKMQKIWIKSFFDGIFVLFQQLIRKLLGGKSSLFYCMIFYEGKYIVHFKGLRMNWTTDPFRCAIYGALSLYRLGVQDLKFGVILKIISLETKSNIIQE